MTVSSSTRRAGPFAGNGVTVAFPFTFKVFAGTDVAVYFTDAGGTQSLLGANYTVTLNADQDATPGGTVNYPTVGAPLAVGTTLDLVGDVVYTQATDLTNLGRYLPQVVENALDKITILIQQLKEKAARAITFPVGDTATTTLPIASARAGMTLAFDGAGNVIVNNSVALAAGSAAAAAASAVASAGSATASATSATASASSATASASSAATAASGASTASAAADQAALLAGVTGVYGTYALMNAAVGAIAANANVMVLADEQRQGQVSIYQKVTGVMTYVGVVQWNVDSVGALGDVDPENTLYIWPGDSTTEQGGASGYLFDTLTSEYRGTGGALQRIAGMINFGASGNTLDAWLTSAVAALPVYTNANLGVGSNDYYGHKAVGAVNLATQLAWRAANAASGVKVVWLPCYGINDCILNAAVGNLSQQGITDYISDRLRQAVRKIQSTFPKDKIILRVPNPMVARPFTPPGPGYPNIVQYPTFGLVDATDQALVEKWNQGIRNGYLAVRNEFPGVRVFDKWELVYGRSDTTKIAGTDLPEMGDLVHPQSAGYQAEAHAILSFIAPRAKVRALTARKAVAAARATVAALQAWEYYPAYLQDNPKYELVLEGNYNARGGAFVDVTCDVLQFFKVVRDRPVYLQVGDQAAQLFSTYQAADQSGGSNTILRFTSVSPSAAMQAAAVGLPVRMYIDPRPRLKQYMAMDHVLNNRCFVRMPEKLASGGVFTCSTGVAVPSIVTVDIYSIASNVRTLLGTITIAANAINGTLSSGNPTATVADTTYEAKLTSATAANAIVSVAFTPN